MTETKHQGISVNFQDLEILKGIERIVGEKLLLAEKLSRATFGVKIKNSEVVGLGLCKKNLTSFPKPICDPQNPQRNWLEVIPEGFGSLSNLTHLNLNTNPLNILPEMLREIPNLQYLWLNQNYYSKLKKEDIQGFKIPGCSIFR